MLAAELARPTWKRDHVALGTNTDPYQRAEGRYRLMPGIIKALAASRTPFSILTKGTLLRRDLPRLDDALRQIRDVGATSVTYDILNIRRGVREWYAGWVRRERPDLVPRYREIYGDGAYASRDYQRRLADRMGALMRKHGLAQPEYLGTDTEKTIAAVCPARTLF